MLLLTATPSPATTALIARAQAGDVEPITPLPPTPHTQLQALMCWLSAIRTPPPAWLHPPLHQAIAEGVLDPRPPHLPTDAARDQWGPNMTRLALGDPTQDPTEHPVYDAAGIQVGWARPHEVAAGEVMLGGRVWGV